MSVVFLEMSKLGVVIHGEALGSLYVESEVIAANEPQIDFFETLQSFENHFGTLDFSAN